MRARMMCAMAAGMLAFSASGWAKLPPLSEEQKIKADETKAKAAHTDKVAAYQLCKSQNAVAESYAKEHPGAKIAPTTCQDPGPFVPPAPTAATPPPAPQAAGTPAVAQSK